LNLDYPKQKPGYKKALKMAGTRANRRVQKELEKFMADSVSDGIQIEVKSESCWNVKFSAAAGTIYEGENYTLEVTCKRCSYHVISYHFFLMFSRYRIGRLLYLTQEEEDPPDVFVLHLLCL
jgi:hypothetical protein